jgi:hypothetical protein
MASPSTSFATVLGGFIFAGLIAFARAAAEKFAEDSKSTLGKIRTARQGAFSIVDRDSTTPHIKKVRVVSTIVYYLSD